MPFASKSICLGWVLADTGADRTDGIMSRCFGRINDPSIPFISLILSVKSLTFNSSVSGRYLRAIVWSDSPGETRWTNSSYFVIFCEHISCGRQRKTTIRVTKRYVLIFKNCFFINMLTSYNSPSLFLVTRNIYKKKQWSCRTITLEESDNLSSPGGGFTG